MDTIIAIPIFLFIVVGFVWTMSYFEKKKLPTRRYLKDVIPGEYIQVEWNRAEGGLCNMKCLNNDPKTKTILLEIRWSNYLEVPGGLEYQKLILNYDDAKLKNFHLLNTYRENARPKNEGDDVSDTDITKLQKQMNEALEKEEYEKATIIQKKIDKLLKK